jgi:hypothetical protein
MFSCPFDTEDENGNRFYYGADYGENKILKFNEKWNIIVNKEIPFQKPKFIKKLKNNYFIGGEKYIHKTDLNGIVQKKITGDYDFHGITFDETTNLLYVITETQVAPSSRMMSSFSIGRYTTDLSLFDSISFPNEMIFSIKSYKGQVYVGVKQKRIFVYENARHVHTIDTKCPNFVTSMNFDSAGFMIIGCNADKNIYLHHVKYNVEKFWRKILRLKYYEKVLDVIIDKSYHVVVIAGKSMYRSFGSLLTK